jgi:hypothetical protein
MEGCPVRHPLNLAVTALWTLGGLYLSLGMLVAPYLLLVQRDSGWIVAILAALAALFPGVAYMCAAAVARRSDRHAWLLPTIIALNGIATLALLLLAAFVVLRIGVIDLLFRPRSFGSGHIALVLLLLLIAYHARLLFHLVRAHQLGDLYPVTSRGFEPIARAVDVTTPAEAERAAPESENQAP